MIDLTKKYDAWLLTVKGVGPTSLKNHTPSDKYMSMSIQELIVEYKKVPGDTALKEWLEFNIYREDVDNIHANSSFGEGITFLDVLNGINETSLFTNDSNRKKYGFGGAYERFINTLIGSTAGIVSPSEWNNLAALFIPPDEYPYNSNDTVESCYYLYRYLILENIRNNSDEIFQKLFDIYKYDTESLRNKFSSFGKILLNKFSKYSKFKGSGTETLLFQISSVDADIYTEISDNDIIKLLSDLFLRLIAHSLEQQGNGFSEPELPNLQDENKIILLTVLTPFLGNINSEVIKGTIVLKEEIKNLIKGGIAYIRKESKNESLVITAIKQRISENTEGINRLAKLWYDDDAQKILLDLLISIKTQQKKHLDNYSRKFQNNHNAKYEPKPELFTLPQELITLLASSEDKYIVSNNYSMTTDVSDLLMLVLTTGYFETLSINPLSTYEEKINSAKHLITLYSINPQAVIKIISTNIPEVKNFNHNILSCTAENTGENLVLAEWNNLIAENCLELCPETGAYEDKEKITSLLNQAKTASFKAMCIAKKCIGIQNSINHQLQVHIKALCLLAKTLLRLANLYHGTESVDFIMHDFVFPFREYLYRANTLAFENDASDESKNFFEAVKAYIEEKDIFAKEYLSKEELKNKVNEIIKSPDIPMHILNSPQIMKPLMLEHNDYFKPLYISTLDSYLTYYKGYKSLEIEPTLMQQLLSGSKIIYSPNQIFDNEYVLKLSDNPSYINLIDKGYIIVSFYGSGCSLCDIAAQQMENKSFTWSSIPFVNYTDSIWDEEIYLSRKSIANYLRGTSELDRELFVPADYNKLIQFKERLQILDLHLTSSNKCFNFQRGAKKIVLPEGKKFDTDYLLETRLNLHHKQKSMYPDFEMQQFAHNIVHNTLTAQREADPVKNKYNRSRYNDIVDSLIKGNTDILAISKENMERLNSYYSSNTASPELMTALKDIKDIVTDEHNFILGMCTSKRQYHEYLSKNVMPLLHKTDIDSPVHIPQMIHNVGAREKYVGVNELGETIRWDTIEYKLDELNAKTSENLKVDKIIQTMHDHTLGLSYGHDEQGNITLDTATVGISTRQQVNIKSCNSDNPDSVKQLKTKEI
ncbi:MAG: hypothetical protein IJ460_06090 [Clostridia bacterium]|nr:hypothetical protein [Clostridia bacterium]